MKYQVLLTTLFISVASCVSTNSTQTFQLRKVGQPFTLDYKIYFENEKGQVISPFHDIPLFPYADRKDIFNMVVEIPRYTNAKFEINKENIMNPIIQDVSNGQPRFVPNIFPFKGYVWNYGALPQTWENPLHITPSTGTKGDNDPIDVLEIGDEIGYTGQIKQVKILGVFGLLDEGETDWKLITIDIKDPLAKKLNDIKDVKKYKPGLLENTAAFYKMYKYPSKKVINEIAYNSKAKNSKFAIKTIMETHEFWKKLMKGTIKVDDIKTENINVVFSPYRVKNVDKFNKQFPKENILKPAPLPENVDKYEYVKFDTYLSRN
ncbi:inorganic pyrophosphatase [Cunninghamella echinulata]|nr:inorganic pyrophosphatase [Cunninghamella echinulata]